MNDQQNKGFFLLNTAVVIASHDTQVNEIVTNGVREIEAFLRRSIEVGQARGSIPRDLEPDATARSLLASLVAIRVLGRGLFAEDALRSIAGQAKKMMSK